MVHIWPEKYSCFLFSPRILGRLLLSKPHHLILLLYTSSAKLMCFRLLRCDSKIRVWGAPDCRGCISHSLGLLFKGSLSLPGLQKPLGLDSKQLEETSESFWIPIIIFCDGESDYLSSVARGARWHTANMTSRTIAGGREDSENGAVGWADTLEGASSPPLKAAQSAFPVHHKFWIVPAFLALQIPFFNISYTLPPSVDIFFFLKWANTIVLAIAYLSR